MEEGEENLKKYMPKTKPPFGGFEKIGKAFLSFRR